MHPWPTTTDDTSGFNHHLEAKRIAALNAIRQRSMVTDAEKLLRLAKELNDDAANGGATLSPADRIHKASEIEKLARNVRDKMTYVAGTALNPNPGFVVQMP